MYFERRALFSMVPPSPPISAHRTEVLLVTVWALTILRACNSVTVLLTRFGALVDKGSLWQLTEAEESGMSRFSSSWHLCSFSRHRVWWQL